MKYKRIKEKAVAPIESAYLYDDKLNIIGVVSNREMVIVHGIVNKEGIEFFIINDESKVYLIEKAKTIFS